MRPDRVYARETAVTLAALHTHGRSFGALVFATTAASLPTVTTRERGAPGRELEPD